MSGRRAAQKPISPPIEPDRLHGLGEVVPLAGASRWAVHQAVRAGTRKAIETEEGLRVRGADLLAWLGRPSEASWREW